MYPAPRCGISTRRGPVWRYEEQVQFTLPGSQPYPYCWFPRSHLSDHLPLPVLRPAHVLQAGKNRLTLDELNRLHNVLIEETRVVRAGLHPDRLPDGGRV